MTSYSELETKARSIASSYRNPAAVLVPVVLTGEEVKKMAIHNTILQSIQIEMQNTLDELCKVTQGAVQCTGTVAQWSCELKAGFLSGEIMIETQDDQCFFIKVKNEFLSLIDTDRKIIAQAPDIITILSKKSLYPILGDQLKIGDEIICITCKGPEIWYTPKGSSLLKRLKSTEAAS